MNNNQYKGRAVKKFWAVTEEYGVELVEGYECKPTPGLWWFPILRYTLTEGEHLFPTEIEATTKAVENAREKYKKAKENLETLENKLAELAIQPNPQKK